MPYKQKLRLLKKAIEKLSEGHTTVRISCCHQLPPRLIPATWDGLELLLHPDNIERLRARLRAGYSPRADFHPGIFIRSQTIH